MKYDIRVCRGSTCGEFFESDVLGVIKSETGCEDREVSEDGEYCVKTARCLGNCSMAPNILINNELYQKLTPESAKALIKRLKSSLF